MARAWQPLAEQVPGETLRRVRAIVVCGGPGYANGMAGRYPLGVGADDPPLVLLALGSHVVPGTDRQLAAFAFDEPTRRFLEDVARRVPFLGARDRLTAEILGRHGLASVLMTGDPAWYDLDRIDEPLLVPARIERVAFSPPANPAYFRQAVRLFERLERAVPGVAPTIVHHRGVQRPFADLAARRGWRSVDITGGATGFAAYDEADLHVGYRVHAHLYATSRGVVSYLVAEDSRGIGVHRTLGELGTAAFDERAAAPWMVALLEQLPRLANAHRAVLHRLGRPVGRVLPLPDVAGPLVDRLLADRAVGFPDHEQARGTIRATLPEMRRIIEALP